MSENLGQNPDSSVSVKHGRVYPPKTLARRGLKIQRAKDRKTMVIQSATIAAQEQDVSKLAIERDEAFKKTLIDPLTGLLTIKGFNQRLSGEINRAERDHKQIAIIFLDLNGLKQINDTFGHAAGDQRIIAAANLLTSSFRPTDLIARRGNKADEFLVALEVEDLEQVRDYYQRVSDNSEPLSEDWDGIPMIFPAGATLLDPKNIDKSIHTADHKMYEAKKASKLYNQNTIIL
jgi:diguanylate cyclase (GGDEF)-like protein